MPSTSIRSYLGLGSRLRRPKGTASDVAESEEPGRVKSRLGNARNSIISTDSASKRISVFDGFDEKNRSRSLVLLPDDIKLLILEFCAKSSQLDLLALALTNRSYWLVFTAYQSTLLEIGTGGYTAAAVLLSSLSEVSPGDYKLDRLKKDLHAICNAVQNGTLTNRQIAEARRTHEYVRWIAWYAIFLRCFYLPPEIPPSLPSFPTFDFWRNVDSSWGRKPSEWMPIVYYHSLMSVISCIRGCKDALDVESSSNLRHQIREISLGTRKFDSTTPSQFRAALGPFTCLLDRQLYLPIVRRASHQWIEDPFTSAMRVGADVSVYNFANDWHHSFGFQKMLRHSSHSWPILACRTKWKDVVKRLKYDYDFVDFLKTQARRNGNRFCEFRESERRVKGRYRAPDTNWYRTHDFRLNLKWFGMLLHTPQPPDDEYQYEVFEAKLALMDAGDSGDLLEDGVE